MATETAIDVVMPQMGVSVSEGTVTRWLKQEGEHVEADEPLLEISTDKVDTEVPSPGSGTVTQILVQEGETVEVGTLLARIGGAAGEAPAPAPAPVAPEPVATEPVAAEPEPVAPRSPSRRPRRARTARHSSRPSWRGSRPSTASTPARCRAPAAAAESPSRTSWPSSSPARPHRPRPHPQRRRHPQHRPQLPLRRSPQQLPVAAAAAAEPVAGETVEPMTAMRRGIADHMRRSLDTSAHVTSAIEVDMSKVVAAREQLKKEYQSAYGVNPTYLAFIGRATIDTLRDYPYVNGELRGDSIVTRNFVNLGIAVELADGKGLIVPVIRNAEGLNLLGLAGRSPTSRSARARSSCFPTTSRAARSRSRTPAATAPSTARR